MLDITTYILSKKYIEDSLAGAGALAGKSAYEIAFDNGFSGSPTEWLNSLKGDTPQIGPAGTWIISGVDTGVIASPSLAGYATEEFVNQQIANIPEIDLTPYATRKELSEAILGIKIPDVSKFVTQEDIDTAIAAIVFPEPDLTPYAKKTEIPSIQGLASEEYVQEQINNIEIPEVDLSSYAKKTDIPDVSNFTTHEDVEEAISQIEIPEVDLTGLATEDYVNNAIANIEIPEAKADVNVYEVTSDSVILDELVALLPEGIEINQGDVLLVTNSLGVKSAYQFDDSWNLIQVESYSFCLFVTG